MRTAISSLIVLCVAILAATASWAATSSKDVSVAFDDSCCIFVGDFDHSGGAPDIVDQVGFVSFVFQAGPPPPCPAEADVNGYGVEGDVHDLVQFMVNVTYMIPFRDCDAAGSPPVDGGSMELAEVTGQVGPGEIASGTPVTFLLRLTNSTPDAMLGVSNGFRLYSPEGAQWTDAVGGYSPGYGQADFDIIDQIFHYGATGGGADTVAFSGAATRNAGIAAGFDQIVYTIEIGRLSTIDIGKQICLDSAYCPPVNTWMWSSDAFEGALPSWDGPHCFTIVSCCVNRGDIDHSGHPEPDITDLIFLVSFMFQDGPVPPCLEEADIDGDGGEEPNIADLIHLVTYMFGGGGPPPVPCP